MPVDQFIKFEGIKGESQDDKHKDEIDVLSWSWGMTQSGTTHRGSGSGGGKVDVQDLTFVKEIDKSSAALYKHCTMGVHIPKATLTCRLAGGDKPVDYLIIEMEKVLITSIQTGGSSGGDKTSETISANFGKFYKKYTMQEADGSAGTETEFKYNIAENKAE